MNITLKQAQGIILEAINKSEELNIKVSIAIMDKTANLLAFARMDNATLGPIDIAIKKAKTAILFQKNTGDLGKLSQPNGPLFNIEHSNGGLVTFPGGIPIKNKEEKVIGSIGVSGSTVENDYKVALTGVKAI